MCSGLRSRRRRCRLRAASRGSIGEESRLLDEHGQQPFEIIDLLHLTHVDFHSDVLREFDAHVAGLDARLLVAHPRQAIDGVSSSVPGQHPHMLAGSQRIR